MTPEQLQRRMADLGFPHGCRDPVDGLRAEFERGSLVRLQWVHDGVPGALTLELDPQGRSGVLTTDPGSGGTADTDVYQNGAWERFDAWSDNTRPEPMRWSAWVQRSVDVLLDVAGCLLCGQGVTRERGAAHTADHTAHLCETCWDQVQHTDPHARQWPLGERGCSACGTAFADTELLYEGRHGKVCPACVDAMVLVAPPARPWWRFW